MKPKHAKAAFGGQYLDADLALFLHSRDLHVVQYRRRRRRLQQRLTIGTNGRLPSHRIDNRLRRRLYVFRVRILLQHINLHILHPMSAESASLGDYYAVES